MYEVQGTLTCPPPHPSPPHNRDIQKRAFYGNGFRSAGINKTWVIESQRAKTVSANRKARVSQQEAAAPPSDTAAPRPTQVPPNRIKKQGVTRWDPALDSEVGL